MLVTPLRANALCCGFIYGLKAPYRYAWWGVGMAECEGVGWVSRWMGGRRGGWVS